MWCTHIINSLNCLNCKFSFSAFPHPRVFVWNRFVQAFFSPPNHKHNTCQFCAFTQPLLKDCIYAGKNNKDTSFCDTSFRDTFTSVFGICHEEAKEVVNTALLHPHHAPVGVNAASEQGFDSAVTARIRLKPLFTHTRHPRREML